ncbi:hypothetical protein BRC88_14435 [Halobacteriales archaeon QS_4_69_225]|nr:MAG: hypothetical protein BRC88_14435 [Halobacteriales archaeon QS_4_69_225]
MTGGWLVSRVVAHGATDETSQLALTTFEPVGPLAPAAASFLRVRFRSRSVSGPFPARTVLGITGLAASFAVVEAAGIGETLILDGVWFAGPAVGFLVTAGYTNGWSRRLYAAAATLGGAVLVVTVRPFESVHYLVAAVVQGLPMLYHGTRLN